MKKYGWIRNETTGKHEWVAPPNTGKHAGVTFIKWDGKNTETLNINLN